MAGGPPLHPHPSKQPRRPTHWPTRRTSVLCPKPGSKWSSSWVVAQPVTAVRGLCSMWRGPPTPGCRTSCLSTWMSGGHSSFWLESLTAPSCCLGRNTAYAGLALPRGRPSAKRGPWHPVYPLLRVVFPLGLAGCRLHLKCQLWTFVPSDPLAQLSQAAWGQGLNLSDLNPAHCAWGPAPGAGTVELQTNKVKKLSFQSGFYLVWWWWGGGVCRASSPLCLGALLCSDSGAGASPFFLESL